LQTLKTQFALLDFNFQHVFFLGICIFIPDQKVS